MIAKLGLAPPLEPTLQGLHAVYNAWCRRIPFDNLRKLMSLRSGKHAPLPGDDAEDFFAAWLRDGTGGTCWAGAGALHALLSSMGYSSSRAIGTMLSRPGALSNHGTVIVSLGAAQYLVDSAILHDAPLPLPADPTHWTTRWRPLHLLSGIDCRIDELGISAARFRVAHEDTRARSPFNDQPYVRINRDSVVNGEGLVIGLTSSERIEIDARGGVVRQPLTPRAAIRFLVEEIGIRETIAQFFFES